MRSALLLLVVAASACSGQRSSAPEPFPAGWYGTWSGEVETTNTSGESRFFQMELTIGPGDGPDAHEWTIVYSGMGDIVDRRPYTLVVLDAANGHYAIDEHNGLVLEARLLGDTLTTWFAVDSGPGGMMLITERLLDPGSPEERLEFELFGGPRAPSSTSRQDWPPPAEGEGLQVISGSPVSVDSWSVRTHQHGVLRRR